jgi:hypothetical protein
MNPIKLFIMRRQARQGHLNLMARHLIQCADQIEELRRENRALRIRGERLAQAIENNDWSIDYAMILSDSVSAWREFDES